jgi:Ca2+-binding EF-hand superfamily protein
MIIAKSFKEWSMDCEKAFEYFDKESLGHLTKNQFVYGVEDLKIDLIKEDVIHKIYQFLDKENTS